MNPLLALSRFYASSIGKKILVAVSGLLLLGFVFMHMGGNLLIFAGRDALNAYGEKLHDLGGLLWLARIGLLVLAVVHVVATVHLTIQNRAAREYAYQRPDTVRATFSSRIMILSGLTVLGFIVYHVLHFTVNPAPGDPGYYQILSDTEKRHDIYGMVVRGFQVWWIAAIYLVSMALLCSHLSHGFSSVFQTLGLKTDRTWPWIKGAAYAFAGLVFVGNSSIVVAAFTGALPL